MTTAKGEFNVTSWDAKPYAEYDEGNLTRADVRALV